MNILDVCILAQLGSKLRLTTLDRLARTLFVRLDTSQTAFDDAIAREHLVSSTGPEWIRSVEILRDEYHRLQMLSDTCSIGVLHLGFLVGLAAGLTADGGRDTTGHFLIQLAKHLETEIFRKDPAATIDSGATLSKLLN